jgi:anti-sigma regulatory factor (Ser/Thr protein kinase)
VDLNRKSTVIRVSESTAVGQARRAAMGFADRLGFNAVKTGEVGIIVTELANNLWRHAGEGEIIFRALSSSVQSNKSVPIQGIEILAIDRGPGMANIEKCSQDGYSSAGTTGIGLGAVLRLSSHSEVYSRFGFGTISLSQVWASPLPRSKFATAEIGAICAPLEGETCCGDGWAEKTTPSGQGLLLADGLGHGIAAAEATKEALRLFLEKERPGREMIQSIHEALRRTVGIVAGLVQIAPDRETLSFIGIGNTEGCVFVGGEKRRLVSYDGTVGSALQKVRQWDYSWRPNSLLILHTDGISGRWDLESYPGLITRHPSLIAGVLYRDFRRARDDASVVVLREPSAEDSGT